MSSRAKQPAKFVRLAAWALCAGPIVLLAAERPAGRPERPASNGAGPNRGIERDRGDGSRAGIGGHAKMSLTKEEWEGTAEFLRKYAPNRLTFVENIGEGDRKENLKRVLFGLVRNINALQVQSISLYNLRIEEFQLDDQIFGICSNLRTAQGAQKEELRDDLRKKVTLLFDKGLEERKVRIERLQKMIEDQKKALVTDSDRRQTIIDSRFLYIASHGVNGAPLNSKGERIPTEPKSATSPASSPGEPTPEE
ncbi:MAG: hypothetical protein JWN24_3278 [Phycisphaerales bacterium]|jgi:hypothetical protein|nr:hypothetical protein [Phycisphaerales bacterium]